MLNRKETDDVQAFVHLDCYPHGRRYAMNTTEKLTEEVYSHGAEAIDWRFTSDRIKGLYCDGVIAISDKLNGTEKAAVLAEELGHHLTAAGCILDQSVTTNRKQELRGRIWAYNRLIGLTGILKAYRAGCRNCYEMAECLDVPEDFLRDAINYYRGRYGLFAHIDNYVIYFEPLGVFEMFDY